MSNEFKLVPIEPTNEMTFVGQGLRYDPVNSIGEIYRRMIAAAPQPPALGGESIRAATKKWFYESFDCDLLEKMEKHNLIAQAEGFSVSVMVDLELELEKAFSANLAPLQAEIERLKRSEKNDAIAYKAVLERHEELRADLAWSEADSRKQGAAIIQLKARCDELEAILKETSEWFDDGLGRSDGEWSLLVRIKAALSKPAGSEQESSLDIPSRTIKLSGCEFTEDDLLRRAVRAVGGSRRNTRPRWALVRDAFGCGSGVGTALCRRFGFDPEEVLKS